MATSTWLCLWERYLQLFHLVLAWKILHRRFPADDRLGKLGFSLAFHCSHCHKVVEDLDHLFLGCQFAQALWS